MGVSGDASLAQRRHRPGRLENALGMLASAIETQRRQHVYCRLDIGDALGSRRQSVVGYSTARIITMIAITTAHDSTERPAMTTTACPLGKRTSASIGGPSLVRLWSTR